MACSTCGALAFCIFLNALVKAFIPWEFSKRICLLLSSDKHSKYMASLPEKAADALESALLSSKSYQLVCLCYWMGKEMYFQKTLQISQELGG